MGYSPDTAHNFQVSVIFVYHQILHTTFRLAWYLYGTPSKHLRTRSSWRALFTRFQADINFSQLHNSPGSFIFSLHAALQCRSHKIFSLHAALYSVYTQLHAALQRRSWCPTSRLRCSSKIHHLQRSSQNNEIMSRMGRYGTIPAYIIPQYHNITAYIISQ